MPTDANLETAIPVEFWGRAKARLTSPAFLRLFKNAGKLQLNRLLSTAVSGIQIAVIARYLSPHDYGIYALILNTVQVVQGVFDVRCSELVLRYFFHYKSCGDTRKSGAVLLAGGASEAAVALVGAAIMVGLARLFSGAFFKTPDYTTLFQLAALIPICNIGSGLAASILAIDRKYGQLALADSLSNIFGFLLLLAILPLRASIALLLWTTLAAQLAKAALRWFYLARQPSDTRTLFFSAVRDLACIKELRRDAREIGGFAVANNFLGLLKIVQGSVPNMLIGYFRGPADVGYYYLGQRIGVRLSSLCTPITDVTYREIAEGRNERTRDQRIAALKHGTWLVAAMTIPVLIGIAFLGHWTVPRVFGAAYRPGVLPIQITVATYAIALLFNPVGSLLMAEGKVSLINLSFGAGLVAQLGVLVWLVPHYASTGAALALAAFYILANVVTVSYAIKILQRREAP